MGDVEKAPLDILLDVLKIHQSLLPSLLAQLISHARSLKWINPVPQGVGTMVQEMR